MPSDGSRKHVLVAGATGRLGTIVGTLLARGHIVRAMTRTPDSAAATRHRSAGAEIVFGDFDDQGSIAAAAADVDVVFASGTAHKAGPQGELRHGRNLTAAAAEANVPHLVYVSGDGAAADSPLPLFRIKYEVEEDIRSLPGAHTILAPVYFMENLFNPWNLPALRTGIYPSPIPVHVPLQQVAVADIADLATLAIERPEQFAGQRISIASSELTAVEAAAAISDVIGRQFTAQQIAATELGPGLQALFGWLERTGHNVDIPALHSQYPEVEWRTYQSWLRSQRVLSGDAFRQPSRVPPG